MQGYVAIAVVWLVLGVAVGVAGTGIGPGIVMLFVGVGVGFVGACVNTVFRAIRRTGSTIYPFVVATLLSLGLLLLVIDGLKGLALAYLAAYVALMSLVGNFLVAWSLEKLDHRASAP
jgi:hypothetical protein